jgi:hypothetical protein
MKITKEDLQRIINEEVSFFLKHKQEPEPIDEGLKELALSLAILLGSAGPAMAASDPANRVEPPDIKGAATAIEYALRELGADPSDPASFSALDDLLKKLKDEIPIAPLPENK